MCNDLGSSGDPLQALSPVATDPKSIQVPQHAQTHAAYPKAPHWAPNARANAYEELLARSRTSSSCLPFAADSGRRPALIAGSSSMAKFLELAMLHPLKELRRPSQGNTGSCQRQHANLLGLLLRKVLVLLQGHFIETCRDRSRLQEAHALILRIHVVHPAVHSPPFRCSQVLKVKAIHQSLVVGPWGSHSRRGLQVRAHLGQTHRGIGTHQEMIGSARFEVHRIGDIINASAKAQSRSSWCTMADGRCFLGAQSEKSKARRHV